MKNKIFNFIIIILTLALLIVISMIVIKYSKNHKNEVEVSAVLETIEKEFKEQKIEDKENKEKVKPINAKYKGYDIEGIIEIPKINIKYPIINITNEDAMKISITKFWGPKVNEIGNYVVAGHNNRDGTMFGKTKYLKDGDIIKLTNLNNETKEYKVFKIYSIDPNDLDCVNSIENGTREITLITCTNGHRKRLITKAREIL